jgi:Glyoxalase/Bleomycin resistance protein/Dioxygenase superfamily
MPSANSIRRALLIGLLLATSITFAQPSSPALVSRELFFGIDHTAIVVGDTDTSLTFYHDLLGMRVAGEADNYGTEQEHLNNVFGAHLRITSLRAPAPESNYWNIWRPGMGNPSPLTSRPTIFCIGIPKLQLLTPTWRPKNSFLRTLSLYLPG